MSAPELRPYQHEAIDRIRAAIAAGHRRILLVVPTGGGKTVISAAMIAGTVKRGRRSLFLAHRRELITQASAKLYAAGVDHLCLDRAWPGDPGLGN
jgi:DNA repair protein RadD